MAREPLTDDEVAFIQRVARSVSGGTHYEVLGVEPQVSAAELERAFLLLVRTWHPDRFYRRELGELEQMVQDNFVEINRAYQVLREEGARAAYDRELTETGRMPPPRSVGASTVTHADESSSSSFEIRIERAGGRIHVTNAVPTPGRPPEAAKPRAPMAIQRVREQIAAHLARAREHYEAGMAEAALGQWTKAESSLYLATRYDARNVAYAAAHKEAAGKARHHRSAQYLQLAEQAESYAKFKEAIDHLRKAVEGDPLDGTAHFRLGRLLKEQEDDTRGALEQYRRAVQKNPKNAEWRLVLAEMYEAQGLKQNAAREVRAILEVDAKHEKARALLKRVSV